MSEGNLQKLFGSIDIYLFDQLLKGRLVPGMRVLDAGCGAGRNLVYFLRNGYEVFGVDQSEEAISEVRRLASVLAPHLPANNFRVEPVEHMTFGREASSRQQTVNSKENLATADAAEKNTSENFDVVLSSAVLHFASDEVQWQAMVDEMWRVLRPGGIFFARLASTIGIEDEIKLIGGRRYHLPDGSDRFLVDERMLKLVTATFGGEFIEPIKTTVVESLRAMTTWVVRKKRSMLSAEY
ncbi:MAG: class I SAM-dependent methyltransferase [bacterium]